MSLSRRYLERPTSYPNYVYFDPIPDQYLQLPSPVNFNMGSSGGLTIFAGFTFSVANASQRVFDCGNGSPQDNVALLDVGTNAVGTPCLFPYRPPRGEPAGASELRLNPPASAG